MGSLTASLTSSPWSTLGSAPSSFAILSGHQVKICQTGGECRDSPSLESANPLRRDLPRFLKRLGKKRQFGSTAARSQSHMSMEFPLLPGQRRILMQTSRATIVSRTNSSAPLRENRQMEREEEDEDHPAVDLKGFTKVLSGMAEGPIPGMQVLRVPVVEERAMPESALDVIVNALKGENPATTQCIFSSQLGQGRTTLGMTVACIVKAVLMSTKLNKMVETGIGSPEWAENIIRKSFEELAQSDDLKDSYLMGEFDVIKELLEKLPAAKEGKILADKMIDNCGTPPEGTGIQNLRKCIIRTKYKYDAATEDRQIVWKKMIINFIERYFYLICFATYAKEQGPTMFPKSFVAWMDEHKELREMIANGKDKLEWSRQVDQNAVNELRGKISGPDFKEKLGEIVTSLYKISHTTYSDMPRGVIKDTLMRKLTCKTLMEILPGEVVGKIQKEMAEKKLTSDFETVVGLVVAA